MQHTKMLVYANMSMKQSCGGISIINQGKGVIIKKYEEKD